MRFRLITLLSLCILLNLGSFPAYSAPPVQKIAQNTPRALFLPMVKGSWNPTTLRFAMQANQQDIACGQSYTLGSANTSVTVQDMRLYVSNIRFLKDDSTEVPFVLDQDNEWQYQNVGLLDFEDKQNGCLGDARINKDLSGSTAPGAYTGVRFDLGVPFSLNHNDLTQAPAPLNIPGMWWNWQTGYRFVRIDLKTPPVQSGTQQLTDWFIHLGSTNCASAGGDKPPSTVCDNPNRVTITLTNFNPQTDTIVADLSGLLTKIDLGQNTAAPAGCMSGTSDPDCTQLFTNFGLDLQTGDCVNNCADQTFFKKQ